MKKRLNKKALLVLIIIGLLMFGTIVYFAIKIISNANPNNKSEIVDTITGYGYDLKDRDTKIYKTLFKDLADILDEEEIDEEAYSKTIAQILAVDFYNLDNKISKNDIGGTDFILNDYKENFILESSETVYKYVETNLSGDREQILPIVTKSEATSVENISYTSDDISDTKAYKITVSLTYKEDLGYPTTVTIIMVHSSNKLAVVEMK